MHQRARGILGGAAEHDDLVDDWQVLGVVVGVRGRRCVEVTVDDLVAGRTDLDDFARKRGALPLQRREMPEVDGMAAAPKDEIASRVLGHGAPRLDHAPEDTVSAGCALVELGLDIDELVEVRKIHGIPERRHLRMCRLSKNAVQPDH